MRALIEMVSKHVKAVMGVFVALIAFVECLTTGVVTSAISLFGIQSSVVNTMVVAPTNLLNTITLTAPPYVIEVASKVFVTCMGPITTFIEIAVKIGGSGVDIFGNAVGWFMDITVRIAIFLMDKVTLLMDFIIRGVNGLYQAVYQFFAQGVQGVIDRLMYFYARKPWGSFSETPLGMKMQQKMEVYCYLKYRKVKEHIAKRNNGTLQKSEIE